MIEVTNLSKQYGDFVALDAISFQATPGSITGYLGPNGAGKTTTMRILTGFTPPSSGTVIVAGHNVFDDSLAVRQKIGYLPESVPLYDDMTATGYLSYIAEIRRLPNQFDCVHDSLEQVGLSNRAHTPIRNFSKGMRQRVGLASVLLHNPPVLILDEPTIGLDPLQVADFREMIRELGKERTVFLSTHILSEAQQICDQIIILNQGKIIAQGTAQELTEQFSPNEITTPMILEDVFTIALRTAQHKDM